MKKLILSIGLAAAAIVGVPAPAHANIGWWDFLEELSGPGPFYKRGPLGIFTIDTAVACRVDRANQSTRARGRLAMDFLEQPGLRARPHKKRRRGE